MTLDSWRYRDPLEVVMREESETCKGCIHEERTKAFGDVFLTCDRGKKHGTRCKEYREIQSNNTQPLGNEENMSANRGSAAAMVIEDSSLDSQVKYMDRLLYAWAHWAWRTSNGLGFPAAGVIWGVKAPVEDKKIPELDCTDEMFDKVDQVIAKLPWRKRKRLFVHYWQDEIDETKAQYFFETRSTYRNRMRELKIELFDALMPDVEDWMRAIL